MKDNRFSRDLQYTISLELTPQKIAFFVLYNKVFISSWQLINSMKTVGRRGMILSLIFAQCVIHSLSQSPC